jgi:glucose-1-phosphate cytidylyltransferase
MIKIGEKPLVWHIMKRYADFGHKNFYLALGYKAEVVKEYFLNYRALNSDLDIDLGSGLVTPHQIDNIDWKVTLINTGEKSMTGGRVKRMQNIIGNETFMLTYGDGLANIDIDKLLEFHRSHGKMITVTAVRPIARFGELKVNENNSVTDFREKPQMNGGWVNGGYFVIEPSFFDLIEGDSTLLEHEPLEKAVSAGELMAYRHEGFWHPMDTKRDLQNLELLWINEAPWKI